MALSPIKRSVTIMTKAVTEILTPDNTGITKAANLLHQGCLVAFPTETVYGLGADAKNNTAVAGIFEAKRRPAFNPLIVHVSDVETAQEIVEFTTSAERLASAFWPGPLTLVLPLRENSGISPLVTAGLATVAIRVPEHALTRKLLAEFGGPIAAPSANPSGKVSPTNAKHVIDGLNGRIAAILDGGNCSVGLESTIVGFQPNPMLLRPGGLPSEAIEACLGENIATNENPEAPVSPGQLASHYATNAPIRLNASTRREGEILLGFGSMDCDLNLSVAGDLIEAAANLFDYLHKLDSKKSVKIAVAPIPDHGLGRAINDRLRRAAAPRP